MTCKDCVFWIMSQCEGAASTCKYLETYRDWDNERKVVENMY